MNYIEALEKAASVADAYWEMGIICGTRFDEDERAFMVETQDETLRMIPVS